MWTRDGEYIDSSSDWRIARTIRPRKDKDKDRGKGKDVKGKGTGKGKEKIPADYDYPDHDDSDDYVGTTSATKARHPELWPKAGVSEREVRYLARMRTSHSDFKRYKREDERKYAGSRENYKAAIDRQHNNVAGRDFAYREDDDKHWDSKTRPPKW